MPVKLAFTGLTVPVPTQRQLNPMLWLGDKLRHNLTALHTDVIHILLARRLVAQILKPFSVLSFASLGALIDGWLNGKLIEKLVVLQEHSVLNPAFKQCG
jgi:hypothetical protein